MRIRQRDYVASADIWSFRRNWPHEKQRVRGSINFDGEQ
jgi:hypothetical protein